MAALKGSGIENLIGAAFGGTANILAAKVCINSLRAYRVIVAVLLAEFVSTGAKTYASLYEYMEKTRKDATARLWIDCLIKPTLLALMLLRAEIDGYFLLQQRCLEMMLPYFFDAGHYNYARYISWYLRQMQHIPT